ncbi:MerR family transcriptional regulator [Clostridium cellulovorans]|uniref:Transcriptional regulator, MerR family n=1 Tax=Clostridium cellulovorans (strain ATCC 35296 / DSM 3052 / OCM 3 / 743B) TaxID=573061 RepID=D9SNB9_CLOC7|nr:effector binding domain-containing protein [Clostridium cellulovorans]ADL53911.1 transcriptional regulator, MerR family [Clostridium cellulovorans 743B]
MELKTISEVSKTFNISTRTLRYYEQIGLIDSTKKEGYSYRVYDEKAILSLQQVLILRKLRIPLKQIRDILSSEDAIMAIEVFKQNINQLTDEISALTTIREILNSLVEKLQLQGKLRLKLDLLSDDSILNIVSSLTLQKSNLKEERSMEELNKATESLSTLKNVRIIHLPPYTVASSHYIGENPEENAGNQLEKFLKDSNLYNIKPDARVFGFNHPNPSSERQYYGYELWVTIPEDMEVPAPLKKKHFEGGMYAAHSIIFPNFHEWEWVSNWVNINNPKYEANYAVDGEQCMGGLLEEHLNHVYNSNFDWPKDREQQIDLLFPIKFKTQE